MYPEATLDLVGGGPLEGNLKNLVSDLKLDGVTFTGVVSRHRIGEVYDRADIFINASCVDAMPVSIIEAFRAGTPVVTTSPDAMRYLIEHERTGLLSAVGDEKALAANVIRLLREGDLAATIVENAYRESTKYEWNILRNMWLKLYRQIANSPVEHSTREQNSTASMQ